MDLRQDQERGVLRPKALAADVMIEDSYAYRTIERLRPATRRARHHPYFI